jgi:hypothetical protein
VLEKREKRQNRGKFSSFEGSREVGKQIKAAQHHSNTATEKNAIGSIPSFFIVVLL